MKLHITLFFALSALALAEDPLRDAMQKDPRIDQGVKVSFAFTLMHPDVGDDGMSFFKTPKVVRDSSSKRPVLRALVPDDAWTQMTESDKEAYTAYVKWLAQDAPKRPEQHQPASLRPDTPEWTRSVELTRKMSPDAWEIVVCKKNTAGKWLPAKTVLRGTGV